MKKQLKTAAAGLGVLTLAVSTGTCGTIFQSGGSGTTYTDALGDGQGSSNLLRDLSSTTLANDATYLYITLSINPAGNIATGGAFNYIFGFTTGNSDAGGDTSASSTHGNAYGRSISFDSSFGGMTDFVGIFGAGGSGSTASPYTSYGFNDYVYGTPTSTSAAGVWTKINTVSSGEPISMGPGSTTNNTITVAVPLSDFADNVSLTSGTTIDFDIFSTGTSGNQTAYDSLANQSPTQSGTFNATAQYNASVLDSYTITATPEPGTLAVAGLGALSLVLFRRRK